MDSVFVSFILSLIVIGACSSGLKKGTLRRAALVSSFSILLNRVNTQTLCGFLALQTGNSAGDLSQYNVSVSSNHFVLLLDILSFFSRMILILFQTLKITKILPAQ